MGELLDDMDGFHHNRPCFFKLILHGHNTEHLRIPPKFVKRLPKELPGQAILRDSSGVEWRVNLCQNAEGIFLQDGWEQYCTEHSLGDNEFLLFKYNGELCFDVLIFGKDGCERVYVSLIKKRRGRPRKTSLPSLLHESKTIKDSPDKGTKRKVVTNNTDLPFGEIKLQRKCYSSRPMAESFTSDFPYFKTCMTKTNVGRVSLLQVPALFNRARTKVVLRNLEDKSWEVNHLRHGKRHFLSGLTDFVRDNKLKIGDICIFELLAKNEIRVHVFP